MSDKTNEDVLDALCEAYKYDDFYDSSTGYSACRKVALARMSPGWQPIETAPTNESVLVFLPNWDHYGPGIYRAILVDMGTGRRWHCTAWSLGRDLPPYCQPTHWMPLPAPPTTSEPQP